jgi:hypothetical protein
MQGSRWVRQGWSIATRRGREQGKKKKTKEGGLSLQEGDVRKIRKEKKRPRKVVCRHKKGPWEKEEKKKKDHGRREGGYSEGKVPCALHQEFLFFGSQVFGLGSSPSRKKYQLLRDLVYEEAMCEGSSGNGLPYAAKAVP